MKDAGVKSVSAAAGSLQRCLGKQTAAGRHTYRPPRKMKRIHNAKFSPRRLAAFLKKQFRLLYAACPELIAEWDHIIGSGVLDRWTIAGGDGSAKDRFEALARRAASLLPHAGDADPLVVWFEALRRESLNFYYGSETNEGNEGARHLKGTIRRVCEASANYCAVLESRALAAEGRAQQQAAGQAADAANPAPEPEFQAKTQGVGQTGSAGAAGQAAAKINRRRGRRPNLKRRNDIHRVIAKHGEGWRDHLPEILAELDTDEVPMERLYGFQIDLGDGASQTARKWEDLDLAVGKERKRVVDALRRYVV